MVPGVGKQMHHTHTCKTRCKTQATQGHRFTFCHSEGFGCKLARHGLSPSALRALCQSAHRAPNARLLAPGGGGDDRAGGPRATHLLARQPYLLDDHKVAACPPPKLPQRLLLAAAAPRSLPRCCRRQAWGTQPNGSANPIPCSQCSAGS